MKGMLFVNQISKCLFPIAISVFILSGCGSGSPSVSEDFSDVQPSITETSTTAKGLSVSEDSILKSAETSDSKSYDISGSDEESLYKLQIEVNGHTLTATLADNLSAEALANLIVEEPLTLELNEYGSFEKVGSLPQALPTDDTNITTEPGDIMLYQSNQMTIFYDTNTWNYTRLGRIDNVTQAELKEILGDGNVTVTLSPVS